MYYHYHYNHYDYSLNPHVDPPERPGKRCLAARPRRRCAEPGPPRKGTNGFGTNGVTANFSFFERGTFWVLPLTYFCLPKSARAYLFSQSVKTPYFRSSPIGVDPISSATKRRGFHHSDRRGLREPRQLNGARAPSHLPPPAERPDVAARESRTPFTCFLCMFYVYVFLCFS